tara:strand:- start:687 stop:1964 length:1278 start_codon:yes stop_codon:yes gene_type:complete
MQFYIIGVDAGGPQNLPVLMQEKILSSDRVAAPKRLLPAIEFWLEENGRDLKTLETFSSDKPEELIIWLKKKEVKTSVLSSGDPLWFGIGRQLIEKFPLSKLEFHPSPSSMQLALSRLGKPWHDSTWISLHGRDPDVLVKSLKEWPKTLVVLPDPNRGGALEVRSILRTSQLEKLYEFWICELLGHPEERLIKILPENQIDSNLDPLHLVVLIKQKPQIPYGEYLPLFGIDDGVFSQYEDRPGLMTKREMRVQILADLELPNEGVLWDVGAGVGSIGLEALRVRPNLKLILIEKRVGCKKLIKENACRLSVDVKEILEINYMELIDKPFLFNQYEIPDRVILGGGEKENRLLFVKFLLEKMSSGGIIVIPIINIEALSEFNTLIESFNCKLRISQHHSSRGLVISKGIRLSPLNPIFIIKIIITE